MFEYFLQNVTLQDDKISIAPDVNVTMSGLLSDIPSVSRIPLFMPLIPDGIEDWKKRFFFDIVIMFITIR